MGAGESLSRSPLRAVPPSRSTFEQRLLRAERSPSRSAPFEPRNPLEQPLYRAAFSPAPFISRPLIPGDPALVDLLDEGVPI